ncbi:FAD-dependent oxidoreductase [Paracoccus sp. S-4012]|uniref:NAD(P)/FAD-dependent oxidoreductase n=1 Tax=Paracoccus sp. S-4012 TaxID=2665648 RepID=UPI0012AF9E25|nr:FAD-dependent oxidoreductase [Paracoccus sp. S-4012]MRX49867.1 FAD-dependent oxidoreductase [Paracoccus sp. S-4012]
MSFDSDVIVIGGGMAGISLAARLSATARVVVLEAEDQPGHHSTGRSAAIFILNYGGPVLRRLNAAAQPFLAAPDEIGEASLLTRRGELLLCAPGEAEAFEHYLADATGMERIDAAEALRLVPILQRERIAAAAWEPEAHDIDVDRMLQGFLRLLRRQGGELRTGAAVQDLARDAAGWRVATAAGAFRAPVVVNAAGGWADQIAVLAGVPSKGLIPLRRSAALIPAPEGHEIDRWPMFANAAETWYAKPDAGKLMVSPADEDPVTPHDVWPEDMVLAEGIARFEEAVTMEVTRVEHRWAGMRTFAPDRVPVVGFDAAAPGFFWLAGQGGYGIQTAPALSALAADLILGRDSALIRDLGAALSPARPGLGG